MVGVVNWSIPKSSTSFLMVLTFLLKLALAKSIKPKGFGIILRTVAAEKNLEELVDYKS